MCGVHRCERARAVPSFTPKLPIREPSGGNNVTKHAAIGIILGSTRPGRNGEAVAYWVYDIAKQRNDAEYELVDIADYDLRSRERMSRHPRYR
jgi:hypothetical protein